MTMIQNNNIPKYPRTPHLVGSYKTDGDNLADVTIEDLYGKYVVITEKVDGSNIGIYFTNKKDIEIVHRNHIVHGDEYSLLLQWAWSNYGTLWKLLGNQFVLYGEWLYYQHTVEYDNLPSYFLAFDLYDAKLGKFCTNAFSSSMINRIGILSPNVLYIGVFKSFEHIVELAQKPSCYRINGKMEGVYIKTVTGEKFGIDYILRCKYVNHWFADGIGDIHWQDKKRVKNKLANS